MVFTYVYVTVLCVCMDKFQSIFKSLKTLDGPFQYFMIVLVAFDGIYHYYFLPEKTARGVLKSYK